MSAAFNWFFLKKTGRVKRQEKNSFQLESGLVYAKSESMYSGQCYAALLEEKLVHGSMLEF